jgi:hypothetical protein
MNSNGGTLSLLGDATVRGAGLNARDTFAPTKIMIMAKKRNIAVHRKKRALAKRSENVFPKGKKRQKGENFV